MWEQHLQHIYQQWCQGNDDYILRYLDFVNFIARQNNMDAPSVLQELQSYNWFKRPNIGLLDPE